jgi:hypothetical protein
MLRPIQVGNSLPISYPVDPSSTFQAGQIAQLKLIGQDIVAGVSDGTQPIGLLDDVRATAFTQPVVDEIVVIQAVGVQGDGYGNYITVAEAKQELDEANIVTSSFVADYQNLILNSKNGVLSAPAGTTLNYDLDGDGVPDSIRTVVNYVYRVTDIPGDDTTIGSGRVTIWFDRGLFETDQFDSTVRYPLNATLFVNADGQFTTTQTTANHPGVALVTGPPSSMVSTLEFLWL